MQVADIGGTPLAPDGEEGFGLVGIVISLMLVALLSVGALEAFAGGAGAGSGSPAQNPTVDRAYDVQAQSSLSTAMQNVRDGAISSGAVSAADLAQYGVTAGPSSSGTTVSGAVAPAAASSGLGGALGFGSVTLAAQSKAGTCWFVWFSASATWYGFEPDATSCIAPSMATAPTPGAGSPGMVGWQQGSFPTTG
jgi:hypothetical protein